MNRSSHDSTTSRVTRRCGKRIDKQSFQKRDQEKRNINKESSEHNERRAGPIYEGDRTKWYRTKWYGQNGSNFYRSQFN